MKHALDQASHFTEPHVAAPVSSGSQSGFERSTNPAGPAREEIRHRAYSIWESAGRPPSSELEHWLKAEIEVRGEMQ